MKESTRLMQTLQRIRWFIFLVMIVLIALATILFGSLGMFAFSLVVGIPCVLALKRINVKYAAKLDSTGEKYDKAQIIGSKEWLDEKVPRSAQTAYLAHRKWGMIAVVTVILTSAVPGLVHRISNNLSFSLAVIGTLLSFALVAVWIVKFIKFRRVLRTLAVKRRR